MFIVEVGTEIKNVSKRPRLVWSSHQKPDVVVYDSLLKEKVVCAFEVHSSPIIFTERKAILGVANLLHLLRCTDINLKKITTFFFPKLEENTCIMHYQNRSDMETFDV